MSKIRLGCGHLFIFVGFALLCTGCATKTSQLKDGIWHAIVQRADGHQIVFNFEAKDSAGKQYLYVMNAAERLKVDSIVTSGDSVLIQLPFFASGFRAKINNDNLEGVWVRTRGVTNTTLPFSAKYGDSERFPVSMQPVSNITGRWSVRFKDYKTIDSISVGEFTQLGSVVTGTFLNPSGDYRYLQGVVSGDSLYLSAFDGGHAFLFTAKIDSNKNIEGGKFYSGAKATTDWVAWRNDTAALPDAYATTRLKPGQTKLNFRFKSIDGNMVSINDDAYNGKVVIVQIMGSWCPNCMDETNFLSDYYKKNKQRGVEVIALAYEYTDNYEIAKNALQAFKKRFDVQYPVLVTGATVLDSLKGEKTLPQVENLDAFPTSIFIDKKGSVRKIYTGFNGPATGEHYEESKKDFYELVDGLLAEK